MGSIESFTLHVDQVLHIACDAVTQGIARVEDGLLRVNLLQVLMHHLTAVHDGPDLQHVEGGKLVVPDVHRELNLHRSPHLLLTRLEQLLQDLVQWEHVMLEDVGEGDDFPPPLVIAVTDDLVLRIVSGSHIAERSLLFCFFQT